MPRSWPPNYEAPGTDLGELQRGLGSVARRAFADEVDDLPDMVLSCVEADPRWDQIDHRDDYYARLAIHAGISPATFDATVAAEESEEHEGDPGASLALKVMSRMASLGSAEALEAARHYIGVGRYWDEVLFELIDGADGGLHPQWEDRVGDLGPALVARWTTEDELAEAVSWLGGFDLDSPPWSALVRGQPALRAALQTEMRSRAESRRTGPWTTLPLLTTDQLLERDGSNDLLAVARALAMRTFSAKELDQVKSVAGDPSAAMHAAAIATLARLGHIEVLDATLDFPSARNPGRGLLFRAFCNLPLAATRVYAVDWLNGPDDYRRRAAASAFARHATQDDLPLVRECLRTEVTAGVDGEQYVICSLASALGRHPDAGPFPELMDAFQRMLYSYGRKYVVEAIASTDEAFPAGIGVDCLWDAESATRTAAAERVDRKQPAAAARIAELQSDTCEDSDVRAAAA